MAYVIPPTSQELLQQILDEIRGLREDLKHEQEIVKIHAITPEQSNEIVRQVQVKLLQQAKRNDPWGGKGVVRESEEEWQRRHKKKKSPPDDDGTMEWEGDH